MSARFCGVFTMLAEIREAMWSMLPKESSWDNAES